MTDWSSERSSEEFRRVRVLCSSALKCVSEKNRAIPNESADPEQCDRDKRIDLQNVVRQLGRDRTGEVAGRENKPEFHRGWHDKQRREYNLHNTEQSKITSDSHLRHLLANPRTAPH